MSCIFCDKNEDGLIYETKMWKVCLSSPQGYIGQCVIILSRHCAHPSQLTDAEWLDLRHVLNKTSDAIKRVFNATHFNESCLMNNFYKAGNPDPHIHYHLRPRYRNPIHVGNKVFVDKEFGHHYNNHSSNELSSDDISYIFNHLKEALNAD